MTGMDGLAIGKKPPLVTRVTGVILLGSTIIAVVGGLSLLWPGTIFDVLWKLNPAAETFFVRGGRLVGQLFLCLGIMSSLAGVGLLKGKTWAWWLTLLGLAAVGAVNLIRLLAGDPGELFGTPFTLGLLWLHVQPNVRKFFFSS